MSGEPNLATATDETITDDLEPVAMTIEQTPGVPRTPSAFDRPLAPGESQRIDVMLYYVEHNCPGGSRDGVGAVIITRHDGAVAMELLR